ncbi:MAG: sugar-transfer associated ATP-grasp domain-containing protein [Dongiaceae bacterium]
MAIALIRARSGFPIFFAVTSLLAVYILVSPGTGNDWAMNPLTALTTGAFALLVFGRLAMGVPNRRARHIWNIVLALLAIVCAAQLVEIYTTDTAASDSFEDLGDFVLLVACPVTLWLLGKYDPLPRLARSVLWLGFAAQVASFGFDALDSFLIAHYRIDSDLVQLMIDFSQFAALQIYFIGLALFLLSLHVEKLNRSHNLRSIGDLARYLFIYGGLYEKLLYPNIARLRLPCVKPILALAHLYIWLPKLAPLVRARFGKSISRQLLEIAGLSFRHGLDAQAYYMFELYRARHRLAAAGYLTRFETKNGLFRAINDLFPKLQADHRSELGDKLLFAERAAEHGVACVPILAVAEQGEVSLRATTENALRCDLFVKPRRNKGAKGTGLYLYLGGDIHLAPDGRQLSRPALLEQVAAQSAERSLMIQPRLVNHPLLRDLAGQSLLAIRLITCMDADRRPVVTHAMLRILCMLEPDWPTKIELAAEIDLDTGMLGQVTADKKELAVAWLDVHPITEAEIAGRVIPCWDEVKAQVLRAHGAFSDRFIIGWDIACTPDGPVVLEGNSYPDVEFLQRVHRRPIGRSPMAPHLMHYLMQLKMPGRRRD